MNSRSKKHTVTRWRVSDLGVSNYFDIDDEDWASELHPTRFFNVGKHCFTRKECRTEGKNCAPMGQAGSVETPP